MCDRVEHCEELSLKGAAVMTCPHCVASSSAEPCHCDATFRLGLRVPPLQEKGDHRLRITLVTLGDWGCSGALTGLVEGKDIEGSPIAPLPPDTHHHVGL